MKRILIALALAAGLLPTATPASANLAWDVASHPTNSVNRPLDEGQGDSPLVP